ncbi:MAG TPA: neutral zinc metallopeptidase [Vicinamibacterales bacterium]|nr:neutral zinc metallopeptidase [Vicinamibacterales bacterium]
MRWEGGRRSTNIEDRRGLGAGTIGGGGIGMLLIVLAVSCLTGTNPLTLLNVVEQASPTQTQTAPTGAPTNDPAAEFVAVVLASTEETWSRVFAAAGRQYREPVLVLFEDSVRSGCGAASAASGPFYCPGDQKVYLDLSFFRELDRRFGAPGDFAQAYVVAHEVGHHVQTLLGINRQVQQAQQSGGRAGANALSVQLELQADCFAGVWGHHANKKDLLDPGDVEEGISAAAAIGDDRLTKGRVSPDSFTHGTSEQRAHWLRQGLQSGDINGCDTFKTTTY